MKLNNFHIALFSTSLLCLAGLGHAADAGPPQSQTITADTTKTLDQAWRVAADGYVEIDNVRGSVVVTGWDQAQVKLTGSLGADSKLEISGDERQLALRVVGTRSGWFGGNGPDHDSDLILNVPRGVALKVGVVSADATVSGVAGKSLDVDSVSGRLRLASDAPEIDVNSVSGEVTFAAAQANAAAHAHIQTVSGNIDASRLGGRIKLETVSGDINLDAGQVQELETGTVSGDARLKLVPAAHAHLSLESMSGDIRMQLPAALSAHVEAKTFSGNVSSDYGKVQHQEHGPGSSLDARVGDGDAQITAQSFSGNIEFRNQGG
jgi:Putative adhesin